MSYQIITDSCCDFTDTQYRDMNVISVPLTVWEPKDKNKGAASRSLF